MNTSRIASIFDRFTTGYHFYLEDLRSGEQVELGDPGPWPIGSCFKLAVLVAYFEALIDGSVPPDSLDTETVIPPDRFSIGGGVITLLDSPIRLTDRHLLHWMLAASDGTATDVLIAKLGLDRVRQTLVRLAPNSTLGCNLNDMVERFRTIPGALDCKTRLWSPEDALRFRRATCELGETNAVDLAGLALKTFQFIPPPWKIRLLSRRIWPRTEMFMGPTVRTVTKTGSLGLRHFVQDCGVIADPRSDQPLAIFGYCAQGLRLPATVVDAIMGLVGLEILKALHLDATSNADWTPEWETMLFPEAT
jgi:beta-lactamase class A